MDYTFRINYPYRRHRYVLQNVLIMQAVLENSSSFVGDPAPTVDRHTTTAFAGILWVVTPSLRSVN